MNNNLKSVVRRFIRSNPFLYKYWLKMRVGDVSAFPTKGDDLHLTGYQRSGNTFAMRLLKKAFPEAKISTHLHSVSSIKLALKYGVPVVVLIREPSQAITSSILKRMDSKEFDLELASQYDIDEYYSFYDYVEKNLDNITLIDFEFLTNEPESFIKRMQQISNGIELAVADCESIVEEVLNSLKNDSRNDGDRNFKSDYKEKRKKEILRVVESNSKFQCCIELNNCLVSKVNN